MRKISSETVREAVREAWVEIATRLPSDIASRIESAAAEETSRDAAEILRNILENARLAEAEGIPICQDTGFPVIFIEQGQQVIIEGRPLAEAAGEGIASGSADARLRASVVKHPFKRVNTGLNIPPVIHLESAPGEIFKITVAAKGAGSENASCFWQLNPGEGEETVIKLISEHVKKVAARACPPLVIGVGIGGTAETAMLQAKKACLGNLEGGSPEMPDMAQKILERINSSGIGPAGFGGKTTALAVNVGTFACHIASLPVAVNINCHAVRRKVREI